MTPRASQFEALRAQPADALLGLIAAHAGDPRPGKIDLGVGVYRDDAGTTPVMRAVKTFARCKARLHIRRRRRDRPLAAPSDGQFCTPITPRHGSIFQAGSHHSHATDRPGAIAGPSCVVGHRKSPGAPDQRLIACSITL